MIPQLTVVGIDEAIQRADRLQRLFLIYVNAQLDWFGETVTTEMKRGHPPGGPHPEVPGELPVFGEHRYIDQTGALTRSIGFTIEQWSNFTIRVHVFAMMPYAIAVEMGTPTSRPYPFFWPVFYKYVPLLMERVRLAVAQAFDEAKDR